MPMAMAIMEEKMVNYVDSAVANGFSSHPVRDWFIFSQLLKIIYIYLYEILELSQ